MSEFQSFLEKCCKQHIPNQSTLREHYLPICYEETLKNMRGNKRDACIGVTVGEIMNSMGSFFANLVAGKLGIELPSNPHLICSKVLHHTNHSTVARFSNDGLKFCDMPEFTKRWC
jgi:hypothetical protein